MSITRESWGIIWGLEEEPPWESILSSAELHGLNIQDSRGQVRYNNTRCVPSMFSVLGTSEK